MLRHLFPINTFLERNVTTRAGQDSEYIYRLWICLEATMLHREKRRLHLQLHAHSYVT